MNSLAEQLFGIIELWIDEDGMRMGQGLVRHEDETISMLSIDMSAGSSEGSFMFAMQSLYAALEGIKSTGLAREAIMGLDFNALPGQGAEFKDVIAVFHWNGSHLWRYGMIDYQKPAPGVEKIVRPIKWDHDWWSPYLHRCHQQFRSRWRPMKLSIVRGEQTVSW